MIKEFIEYLNNQVKNHSIYVWGAQGQTGNKISESWIRSRESKTGDDWANKAVAFWKKQCNAGYGDVLRAFDCSGLICYYWQNQKNVLKSDHNANALMNKCTLTEDRKPGYLVFRVSGNRATHVGAIVEDDYVIHAKGRDYGVVKEKYKSSYWHKIGKPKFISFDEDQTTIKEEKKSDETSGFVFSRILKKGVRGEDVIELKKMLIANGYTKGITTDTDSSKSFGPRTLALVKQYQNDHELEADGVAGSHTITSLGGTFK